MNIQGQQNLQISLIIPVRDEAASCAELVASINRQTYAPAEIIIVDGGSTDGTADLARNLTGSDARYRIIEAGVASPGRGRNVGAEAARGDWLAFTDAGIKLSNDWLEKLVEAAQTANQPDIIYGNYAPVTRTFFEKCAAFAYVPGQGAGIRGKFIASSLYKKEVWEKVGGFPDLRAAEDLMFMEAAEKNGFQSANAPAAMVFWSLRPDLFSTFRKFALYSKYNVWAGRQWDWHYGILRQYAVVAPFAVLAVLHSAWWWLVIPLWLAARAVKRMLPHRSEFGAATIFNPLYLLGVMFLIVTIDAATFLGWAQAVWEKK